MCVDEDKGGLGLKGNDLIVFSVIFGFCQQPGHYFNGSLAYLQEWTGASRTGVLKNLDSLLLKGLISKEESKPTNIYRVNYDALPLKEDLYVNKVAERANYVDKDVNNVAQTCQHSEHNNIVNTINNTNNKYVQSLELENNTKEVINYLNKVCSTNFKSSTLDSRKLVKQRLSEGYTIDDFKTVIDSKWKLWGQKPITFQNGTSSLVYLRPSTLFGSKFESYLYEARCSYKQPTNSYSVSSAVDTDVSTKSY